MLEIIPVLPVEEPCVWCEPQKCYTASVWWGDCLLSFYTTDPTRLAPNALNDAACEVLRQLTMAVEPESETIIDPKRMWDLIGNAGCFPCYWEDFRPAVLMGYSSSCCIPIEPGGVSPAQSKEVPK